MNEPRRGDWSEVPVEPALAERSAALLAEARAEPWSAEARARVQAQVVASSQKRAGSWGAGAVVIAGMALAGGAMAMWGAGRVPERSAVVVAEERGRVPKAEGAPALAPKTDSALALAPKTEPAPALAPKTEPAVAPAPKPEPALALAPASKSPPRAPAPAPKTAPAAPAPAATAVAPEATASAPAASRASEPAPAPDAPAPTTDDAPTAEATALALRAALDHLAAGRLPAAHDLARSTAAQHPRAPLASELRLVQLEAALRLRRPRDALAALAELDVEAQPRRVELTVLHAELWAAIGDCAQARTRVGPVLADATTTPELRARAARVCP